MVINESGVKGGWQVGTMNSWGTWKIDWMCIEVNVLNLTVEGLRTSTMGNGPIKWGSNFLGVSFKLMSQGNSHTFWLI